MGPYTLDGMIGGPEGGLKSRFAMPRRACFCGKSHIHRQRALNLVTAGVQSACYSDKLELGSSMSTIADSPHSFDA